jgi:anti-sigma B factor antagonist
MAAPTVLPAPHDFDVYGAPAFREQITAEIGAGRYHLVVDLSQTTYIDTTGLGMLVGALKRARAHGGWVRLAGPRESVLKCLRLTGLTKVFQIFDTVKAAINYETEGVTAS